MLLIILLIIEIKFDRYKSVSCFTGNLDRRSQKEGILGIIFEENEVFGNLDLFLIRNLNYISNNQNDQVMEEIYTHKFLRFLWQFVFVFLQRPECPPAQNRLDPVRPIRLFPLGPYPRFPLDRAEVRQFPSARVPLFPPGHGNKAKPR